MTADRTALPKDFNPDPRNNAELELLERRSRLMAGIAYEVCIYLE